MGPVAALRRRVGRERALACREAVELVTDYLEGALPAESEGRFEGHLAGCAACTAYLGQMRTMVATLGHLVPDALPAAVVDELIGLFRQFHA